jgi:hypothetical protein
MTSTAVAIEDLSGRVLAVLKSAGLTRGDIVLVFGGPVATGKHLGRVLGVLATNPGLWRAFADEIPLFEGLVALGNAVLRECRVLKELSRKRKEYQAQLGLEKTKQERKLLAEELAAVPLARWHARRCHPLGSLADKVNAACGRDVCDGLSLAALAFALGSSKEVKVLVETVLALLRHEAPEARAALEDLPP